MKRILKSFLLSILIVMALGTAVQAKDVYKYNYKTIGTKQNKWYTTKEYEYDSDYTETETDSIWTYKYTYYRYKITVPANNYLTMTFKNSNSSINVYKSLKADEELLSISPDSGKKSVNVVLPKGIYYFGLRYDSTAFKYKFTKYVTKANYKGTKALWWGANKKIAIVQTPGHNFERWYKIKVTKNKRITIWGADDIDLFNAKRQALRITEKTNSDGKTFTSYSKLKPGTYYIRILGEKLRYRYSSYPWYGSVSIVWWK